MDCRRTQTLLSPLVDGELEAANERAVRTHLAACPQCAARFETLQATRAAVADLRPAPSEEGWTALEWRLRSLREDGPDGAGDVPRDRIPSRIQARRRWALAAAILLAVIVASAAPWILERSLPDRPADAPTGSPEADPETLRPDLPDGPDATAEPWSAPGLETGSGVDLADQPCARAEDCGADARRLWPHFPL